jgi:hypothetical protein
VDADAVHHFAAFFLQKRNGTTWKLIKTSWKMNWPESRNASKISKTNDAGIGRKEVISVTDKKESNCGCGCLPDPKKDDKILKPEVKKPEKA